MYNKSAEYERNHARVLDFRIRLSLESQLEGVTNLQEPAARVEEPGRNRSSSSSRGLEAARKGNRLEAVPCA